MSVQTEHMVQNSVAPILRFKEFHGNWDIMSLQEITKINQGLQIAISQRFTEPIERGHFYITNEFLKAGSTKKYFIQDPPDSVLCQEEDILMTRTGNTGQVVTGVSGAFHNNFFKINHDGTCDKWFLYFFLKRNKTQHTILKLAGTSTIPDLNHGDFYRIKIAKPSLPEQQKIANFLSSVDTKIQQLTQKKELLELYKKGIMQKLFSQELRFKQEDGSEYPEWEEKKLGEVFKFKQGFQFPIEEQSEIEFEGSVEFIRIINVTSDANDRRYVPNPGNEHHLNKSDLFMVRYGDAGKIAKGFNGIIANNMFRLLPQIALNKLFYFYFLAKQYSKIHALAGSSTMPAIKFGTIRNLKVPYPSKREQRSIAFYLSGLDEKLETVNQQLEKTQEFKKGLLQQMFV